MPLNDLKPAWKQYKLQQALPDLETREILALIEHPEVKRKTWLTMNLLQLFLFTAITLICQGG